MTSLSLSPSIFVANLNFGLPLKTKIFALRAKRMIFETRKVKQVLERRRKLLNTAIDQKR